MSKTLGTMPKTGRDDVPLTITQFCGPTNKGMMLQLTQDQKDQTGCEHGYYGYYPGYIQISKHDAQWLLLLLEVWLLDQGEETNDPLSTT